MDAFSPGENAVLQDFPWGHLEWYVSGPQKNSATMTVGRCTINPGDENPRHIHPNCDEVLHLLSGTISHSIGDESWTLKPGDTISIPAGAAHNAKSIGTIPAVMIIAFSSSEREFVLEENA